MAAYGLTALSAQADALHDLAWEAPGWLSCKITAIAECLDAMVYADAQHPDVEHSTVEQLMRGT